jgi:hypothetical protein
MALLHKDREKLLNILENVGRQWNTSFRRICGLFQMIQDLQNGGMFGAKNLKCLHWYAFLRGMRPYHDGYSAVYAVSGANAVTEVADGHAPQGEPLRSLASRWRTDYAGIT